MNIYCRAFTYVIDIVDGLVRAMDKGRAGEVYNLGNPANKTTILDLAERVIEIVGQGAIVFTDAQLLYGKLYAEAVDKYPNATKAQHDLGRTPTCSIDQTIKDAYRYMCEGSAIALSEQLC